MNGSDHDPDSQVARLMARIQPGWDAARSQRNLTAILERLKGPRRWHRAWETMLAATRLRYRSP